MTSKQKVKLFALIIAIIYVGIGSIKLDSIINGSGNVFNSLGETFEALIFPSYFIGFALGFGGGGFFAMIGQIITLGFVFSITYVIVFSISHFIARRRSTK